MRGVPVIFYLITIVVFCKCKNETFVLTDTWKVVEEGQALPGGVHVRLNLQTGKKEAKLLSNSERYEDNTNSKSALVKTHNEEEPIDLNKLKESLKKIKDDGVKSHQETNSQFRSYDEIKEDFKNLNLNVKSDFEILAQLMSELQDTIKGSDFTTNDAAESILNDLIYLLHQYDNAVEFASRNGFETIVLPILNKTTDNQIRSQVLQLVGSATQSNPRVQLVALESGCVSSLLKLLTFESDSVLRLRCLHAISCLVRSFPQAQLNFVQMGGVTVLTSLFDGEKNEKMQLKIVNLITDLLLESHSIHEQSKRKKLYSDISLGLNLREHGWCKKASDWLSKRVDWKNELGLQEDDVDHEVMEAAVDLLQSMADTCLADYVTDINLLNAVSHANEFYGDLALLELEDGVNDALYNILHRKLGMLVATFARNLEYKDEL